MKKALSSCPWLQAGQLRSEKGIPSHLTLQVEQDVGLVVLEHLSDQLHVHVLDVDLLKTLVEYHDGLIELLLLDISTCLSPWRVWDAYDIGDDA